MTNLTPEPQDSRLDGAAGRAVFVDPVDTPVTLRRGYVELMPLIELCTISRNASLRAPARASPMVGEVGRVGEGEGEGRGDRETRWRCESEVDFRAFE
ncbi:hypothetical protein NL676_037007 [Syzygium grande]|nr:hypothetical protein NL676_037007 [Syzygium grande]